MDFELTREQQQIRKAARQFAEEHFPDHAREMDQQETYPHELVQRAAKQGFVGATLPQEYGGAGVDLLTSVLVAEELNAVDPGLAGAIGSVDFGTEAILQLGTEDQKQRFLEGVPEAETITGAAISEPEAGSDVAGATCRAEKDGDEWVVDGTKMWITNGTVLDYMVTLVLTDPDEEDRHDRHSLLVIPADTDGYEANKITGKLGIRASDTAEIKLDDARVPEENLLGERGEGFRYIMSFFNEARIGVAAQAVGIAQGCLEMARDYATQRRQFGQPIANFQAIQFKLAEMATKTEASRLMTYKAARNCDKGEPVPEMSSKAKWFAGETAVECADECVQIHGGSGYVKEMDAERFYRDAKITEVYEGTKEIHKLIIARSLLDQIG
jgi:alkylation response protein AidB-like acyl-CoA dehydrogenase